MNTAVLAGFIMICLGAGFLGGMITQASIPEWYSLLQKPPGNPPNWVFGPVWTVLYILMAVSVWRVWRIRKHPQAGNALSLFSIQFALNVLWTPAFFGLRNPLLGLFVIILLWIAIGLTVRAFSKIDKTSAALLLPYWGWVTYAVWLNAGIAWLNRG